MQVGLLQYDVVHNAHENLERLEAFLHKQPCELAVLPELSMCGYLFESREALLQCAEPVPSGPSTQRILALSQKYACTIIFGIAEREGDKVFNTAVVVSRGQYLGNYRKIHLSDFEKKLFDRGEENRVFQVEGVKIGVQICFDLWFPEVSREQLRMGADILCVLGNFGGETTYHISQIRAIENVTPLVLCNRTGFESMPGMDADFIGKSTAVNASGERIYLAPEKEEAFGVCEVEPAQRRANVICSDFMSEIARHTPTHLRGT